MKKQKLTDWFPADVKPLHVGVYQRGCKGKVSKYCYWYWNGDFWETGGWPTAKQAALNPRDKSCSVWPWRGLANPPKETKQKGEK